MSNPRLRTNPKAAGRHCPAGLILVLALLWLQLPGGVSQCAAAPPVETDPVLAARYPVHGYVIEGKTELSTNLLFPLLSKYSGRDVSMAEIVRAAADLQFEYGRQGYPTMNIIIAPKKIAGGLVTLDVFQGAVAQIIVAGTRYMVTGDRVVAATPAPAMPNQEAPPEVAAAVTNAPAHTVATNTGPKFVVRNYDIMGNTILPPSVISQALTNVPGAFGTNVTIEGIKAAATGLQEAYRARGYVTVAVSLPPQKLTNATVKVQVTEGRLATIEIKGNHYFSSNNVMRSLPSLHTNEILNGIIFQAELNRANANQDRQISPVIGPGPDPGTSDLTLKVQDRFPLHAKVELNNQSSPGTPDLRVASSVVLGNLWQQDQTVGLQYNFSPELYKTGTQWDLYDQPLVATYSGFYRIPLGSPESIGDTVVSSPGTFGYSEATRKFILPPASGQPELTFFASRSTIDTGVETISDKSLYDIPGVEQISQKYLQQDLTVNNDLGFRLSAPLPARRDFHSDLTGGLDFKTYQLTSTATNDFISEQTIINAQGQPVRTNFSTVASPVPLTLRPLEYLPLSLRYSSTLHDSMGNSTFGLGVSFNAWYSGSRSNLDNVTSSPKSAGHWATLTPGVTRTFEFAPDWVTTIRANGQWTTEPLISNEQFGAGGVNSVRGYQEGQVFGDNGWRVSLEQQTAPRVLGTVDGKLPLTVRGSIYTDYADTYLIDPRGRAPSTALWGAGVGGVATLGSHWEARFLFSVPLLGVDGMGQYDPFFNFSLTAQF